jgi:hypothetical protein
VLAKRAVGAVTLHYSINGGAAQTAPTTGSPPGERYGGNNAYNVYYHYLRGTVPGLQVNDSVEYWFTGGGETTEHATFNVVEDSNDADVLILAAEDRTGASTITPYPSTSPATPNYLSFYEDALKANGIAYDVYDVDAMGRTAPDHLGVLDHHKASAICSRSGLTDRSTHRLLRRSRAVAEAARTLTEGTVLQASASTVPFVELSLDSPSRLLRRRVVARSARAGGPRHRRRRRRP